MGIIKIWLIRFPDTLDSSNCLIVTGSSTVSMPVQEPEVVQGEETTIEDDYHCRDQFLILSSVIASVETSTMLPGYISKRIGNDLRLSMTRERLISGRPP